MIVLFILPIVVDGYGLLLRPTPYNMRSAVLSRASSAWSRWEPLSNALFPMLGGIDRETERHHACTIAVRFLTDFVAFLVSTKSLQLSARAL